MRAASAADLLLVPSAATSCPSCGARVQRTHHRSPLSWRTRVRGQPPCLPYAGRECNRHYWSPHLPPHVPHLSLSPAVRTIRDRSDTLVKERVALPLPPRPKVASKPVVLAHTHTHPRKRTNPFDDAVTRRWALLANTRTSFSPLRMRYGWMKMPSRRPGHTSPSGGMPIRTLWLVIDSRTRLHSSSACRCVSTCYERATHTQDRRKNKTKRRQRDSNMRVRQCTPTPSPRVPTLPIPLYLRAPRSQRFVNSCVCRASGALTDNPGAD
jgi:hypothetical protein